MYWRHHAPTKPRHCFVQAQCLLARQTRLCAWHQVSAPAALGGLENISFLIISMDFQHSFSAAHARWPGPPGHRGRPTLSGTARPARFETNCVLSFCKPCEATVCDYSRSLLDGLSPRTHHLSSLRVWPKQRCCLSFGTNVEDHCMTGPSIRWGPGRQQP